MQAELKLALKLALKSTFQTSMLFPLGQNEDSSQGHSVSDGSGKALQKVGERSVMHRTLVKRGWVQASALGRRLLPVTGAGVSISDLSAFLDMRRCRKLGS